MTEALSKGHSHLNGTSDFWVQVKLVESWCIARIREERKDE